MNISLFNKSKKSVILICFTTFCFFNTLFGQFSFNSTNQHEKAFNLCSYAKAYGYIRFFYPSIKVEKNNWVQFLAFGITNILKSDLKSKGICNEFRYLFNEIAPLATFTEEEVDITNKEKEFRKTYLPNKYWFGYYLHKGAEGIESSGGAYKSEVKFKHKIAANENIFISKYFENELYFSMPILLPYFRGSSNILNTQNGGTKNNLLYIQENKFTELNANSISIINSIAATIDVWNIIKHFYPIRNFVPKNWDTVLYNTINELLESNSDQTRENIINRMISKINDGHAAYFTKNKSNTFYLPIQLEYLENKFVITNYYDLLHDEKNSMRVGNVLLSINNMDLDSLFNIKREFISGSEQFKIQWFMTALLGGDSAEKIKAVFLDNQNMVQELYLYRNFSSAMYFSYYQQNQTKAFSVNEKGISYINLQTIYYKDFVKLIDSVNKTKGIVFDLRGYPNPDGEVENILSHLLSKKDTSKWIRTPIISYPDFNKVSWKKEGWNLRPINPHVKIPVIFLCNAKTYSYAESIIGYVKAYELGTIVGEKTAGANGDVNMVALPNLGVFVFTGLEAVMPSYDEYFGKGILPDIQINPTRKSIIEKEDFVLNYAIEILEKRISKK